MAHILRDKLLKNITLDENTLKELSDFFKNKAASFNENIDRDDNKYLLNSYIIRFDGKGYRVYDIEQLLAYFHQAKEIEHIIYCLEAGESILSNRCFGTVMELRLDKNNGNLCTLMVTSDEKEWVDASFSILSEILEKCKNKNWLVRSAWTEFFVQIFGISLGFTVSLWFSSKLSSHLSFENSYAISFLFVLFIFSNIWTYLNKKILEVIDFSFPNLKFYRIQKDRARWFTQALIGGIALAGTLWIISSVFSYATTVLRAFMG